MKSAVIYARKSTTWDDRQALSLESQLDFCKKKAKEEGLNVVEVIQESMSAKDPGRPGFAKMMALIEKGKADHIVCWKLNRLSRNMQDWGGISFLLTQAVIKAIHTTDGTYTPETNVLLLSVHFGLSSAYSIDLRKDVMRWMATSIKKWNVIQRLPPWYKKDKNTNEVVHTEYSRLIREAFEMRKNGETLLAIRAHLTKRGLKVSKGTMENILQNRFYYGFMLWQGEYFRWNYQPIVTKELYDAANKVHRGVLKKHVFPLKGIIQTPEGKHYLASVAKGKYTYYHKGNDYISEDELIEAFDEMIKDFRILPEQEQELIDTIGDYQKIDLENTIGQSDALEARIKWLRTRQNNLFEMRIAWEIESEAYKQKNEEIHSMIVDCEEELKKINSHNHDLREQLIFIIELLKNLYSKWKSADKKQKIIIMGLCCEKISRTPAKLFDITFHDSIDYFLQNGGSSWEIVELYNRLRSHPVNREYWERAMEKITISTSSPHPV